MTQNGRFWFDYERVDAVFDQLMEVPIDEFTVSNESMNKIRELLKLDEVSKELELRAIRNAIVDRIHDLIEKDDSNWKKLSTQMSGLTAVIDNELWKKFGHV